MILIIDAETRVFFTSDSHYGHPNIVAGISKWAPGTGQRDFQTLEEMNDRLVNEINAVVRENDILFHLGDWSFGGIENIWEFRKRIKCKTIHLLTGNHDHHIRNNKVLPNVWCDSMDRLVDGPNPMRYGDHRDEMFNVTAQQLFESVNDVLRLEIRVRISKEKTIKKRFVLSHFPFASWEDMNDGVIHLHGHLHLEEALALHDGKSLDVGVDGAGYSPYIFQSIVNIMRNRPVAYTVLVRDHHITKRDQNESKLEEGSPS